MSYMLIPYCACEVGDSFVLIAYCALKFNDELHIDCILCTHV